VTDTVQQNCSCFRPGSWASIRQTAQGGSVSILPELPRHSVRAGAHLSEGRRIGPDDADGRIRPGRQGKSFSGNRSGTRRAARWHASYARGQPLDSGRPAAFIQRDEAADGYRARSRPNCEGRTPEGASGYARGSGCSVAGLARWACYCVRLATSRWPPAVAEFPRGGQMPGRGTPSWRPSACRRQRAWRLPHAHVRVAFVVGDQSVAGRCM